MEVLIHAANVLYLFSYLVRDILWLRVLTVVAATTLTTYFFFQDPPLWAAIAWNTLFIGINVYQIYRLLLERRPVVLDAEESELYQRVFRSLTPREFKTLVSIGDWQAVEAGSRLVEQGESLERLYVIVSGRAAVEVDGKPVAELESGRFIGEFGFLTGEPASGVVRTVAETRYVAWPIDRLKSLLDGTPDLRAAWQFVLGTDLVAKLKEKPA